MNLRTYTSGIAIHVDMVSISNGSGSLFEYCSIAHEKINVCHIYMLNSSFAVCAQTGEVGSVEMNELNRPIEAQTDMQQGGMDLQSHIHELSTLTSQSVNQLTSGIASASDGQHEMNRDLSTETKDVMSGHLGELQSTITAQEAQLRQLYEEKLMSQLEKTTADLQSKEADCHQLGETVASLKQQLAAETCELKQLKDHEDDLQKVVEACQAELSQNECKWHEVVDKKEQLVMELRSDLEALIGSVQRREHMWDSARQSMEQEIETMRLNLSHQTAEYHSKVQVICVSCLRCISPA